jgi:hypothetical protein
MKYVYLPESFLPALRAAGLTLTGAEDVKKLTSVSFLSDILSPADVAFYIYVNVCNSVVLPPPISASLESAVKDLLNPGADTGPSDSRFAAIRDKFQEYTVNDSAPFIEREGKVLYCAMLDENTILLSHIDGDAESERDMYDRVIRTLHAIIPFEVLADMPLFGAYLTTSQAALIPSP